MEKGERSYLLGAPSVLIGDPTQTDGAGMFDLEQIPQANIDLTPSKAYASDVGGHQQAEGAFDRGMDASVQLTLNDAQHAIMVALLSNVEADGAASGEAGLIFPTEVQKLAPRTLCVIPNGMEDNAIDKAPWWLVAADDSDLSSLNYVDAEGEDANESFTITFTALKAQADLGGTDLPRGTEKVWKGSPATHGLPWSLPGRYATGTAV